MEEIIVKPCDVWAFFKSKCMDGQEHLIARNDDYGLQIVVYADVDGNPEFNVNFDDITIDDDFARDERECTDTVRRIYGAYLTSEVFDTIIDIEKDDDEDEDAAAFERHLQNEAIEDREAELNAVFEDFLDGIAPDNFTCLSDLEEIKDDVLELLARKYDIRIFRPMYLEDENGVEFYEEFPYECMIFDDEKN